MPKVPAVTSPTPQCCNGWNTTVASRPDSAPADLNKLMVVSDMPCHAKNEVMRKPRLSTVRYRRAKAKPGNRVVCWK
jgi:hypothetical protein